MRTRTVVHGRKWDRSRHDVESHVTNAYTNNKYHGREEELPVVSPNILGVAFGYVALSYMPRGDN